jgi:hypothetical protein
MVAGAGFGALRFAWPRFAPGSFQRASAVYFHYVGRWRRSPTPDELGWDLLFLSLLFVVLSVFIFFRRAVWWWDERQNERSITHLHFK